MQSSGPTFPNTCTADAVAVRRKVEPADIIKGYQVGKGEYLQIEPEELEAIAIESKRTIDIDEFVLRKEIDELYFNTPYYIVPDGEVGQQHSP
jgi:DNA end-binding protein Ku